MCSALITFRSAIIAFQIISDNRRVILNIFHPAIGMISGIVAIVLAVNAIKEKAPKWICIVIIGVSGLSAGICMLNFIACVACISIWFEWL